MADDARDTWVAVAPEATVQHPPWTVHDVAGHAIVLLRDPGGQIHAVGAACPHLDAPLTSAEVEQDTVSCPRHWYTFRLADGHNLHPGWDDCRLPVHACRVVDGTVEVAIEERP